MPAMDLLQALELSRGRMMQGHGASAGLPDREVVLSEFRAARETSRQSGFKTHISQVDEAPQGCSAPLPSLRPIRLREMTVGRRHLGRVLHGTLIETPFKITGIMTILEDSAGDVVTMAIYHAAVSSVSRARVEALFPKGMRLAVKEPYFKVSQNGQLVVRVDNPADIVDWSLAEGEEDAGLDTSMEAVESIREEGKRYFSTGQWAKAMEAYSRCLRVLEARSSCKEVVEQCAVVYSNRAEAWLRLDHHANALDDAVKALERDKSNTKSLVRKVRALIGLQCYQEAILCLQNMLRQKPPLHPQTRTELKEMLKEAEVSDKQSRLGVYNLNGFYRSGTKPSTPLCDFVGPVEVRKVDNHALGRGLFATKEVKAGSLLVVSNVLALASSDPNGFGICLSAEGAGSAPTTIYTSPTEDLITNLIEVCRRYPVRRQQLYSLSHSTPASVSEVPSMTLFTAPVNSREALAASAEQKNAEVEIDVARIRRIVKVNAFQGSKPPEGLEMTSASGLWVLPSLVNHSCVPNAHCSVVEDAMFMRAVRDIAKGEQITILHCCGHQPLLERARILSSQFNFKCCCPRCCFERSFAETVPELTRLAEDSARLLKKDKNLPIAEVTAAGTKIASAVEEILRQVPAHDEDKKDWIRASFRRAYMCQASQLMLVAMGTCDWEPWAEAMNSGFAMMLSVVPDEEVLAHVANAVHHLPVSKTWRTKWTQLAKRICTLVFGPLEEATLNALVKKYSQEPLFPPMHSIASDSRDGGDVCV